MQLNIHDSTLKRVGFINNNLPDALHYFDDNWHRYLAEGTSTFDFSVNKVNSSYALLTLQSYISFTYDGEDYLFNIINIEQDHYSMHLQCENLNLELISEEVGAYGNTKRHSIVWYLKNVAKITNDFVEIGNNPFPLNDEDSSNPILSFDSTDTKLARIISICNSFNAEFQFRTQLKNDGTLQNITIDLYKEEGVGQKRKDVTLYYGKNIAGITSKADRTSTFFNATTVTDSKNKFNWLSVEGKHYNSDGQLEFYKNAGDNTAYAPLSRDMFPSQLKSSSSDRYTRKNLSIEATSANSLWDYAVSQFKLYAYPQMTYEVVVSVNAVTSALGNDKKLNIGDTIIVQDSTFDKSDGGLILSARVSEQEISFTNPLNNKITFTNFVRLTSDISADLYGRMKDLINQSTPYRSDLETTNGTQFKNGKGSTTLSAHIFKGSATTETIADSYEWSKDGTVVAPTQTITVDASGVVDKAVYSFKATVASKVVASQSVTITNVDDGIAGKDGVGIRTTTITYAGSTSGTTAPTSGWTSTVPTVAAGQYLWTKTVWNYSDTTSETGYSVSYIAKDGNDGHDGIAGKDGTGIKTTTVTYAGSTSGTTAPTGGWTSTVPTVAAGSYLWTKTVWAYTDNTSETGYSVAKMGEQGHKGVDGTDAPTITVKSYTNSAGSKAEIELTGPNAFKQTVYNRGHNVWVIDATTHKLKEFVNCDTYTSMSFSHNGVSTTLADYLTSLKDSIVVIAAADADTVDQNVRYVLNCMGGSPDLGTWGWRVGHVFIGMSKRNDGTWPLQPRQGYEEAIIKDGAAPEIGCTLSKGGIVANGAAGPKGNDGKPGADGHDGRAGKDGDPGKIVSDTEPTTKFKGLTWKYIGIKAIDASDGTNIQPNTEYYWNGKNWVINLIKAQNIDVDNLSAITAVLGDMHGGSLTISKSDTQGMAFKDDAVKSWDISKVTDDKYPDGYSYTSMGVALNSGGLTFYSAGYGHALKKGEVIDSKYEVASLQAIASNGRSRIGKGLVLNATNPHFPFTINGDIDVIGRIRQTSLTKTLSVGNGLSIKFTKNGLGIVQAEFKGEITTVNFDEEMRGSGSVWVSQNFCPPETISLVGHFAGDNDSFHIDIETTGRVVWWGSSVSGGGKTPRGTVLYFAQ